ncbi:MAG: cytochrome c oxidase subunit II [Anaerolineae bacterium]|nr:cytochrome c oxidase subunit II [Anaerolineae bacterium]
MRSSNFVQRWAAVVAVLLFLLLVPTQAWAQSGSGSLAAGEINVLFNVVLVIALGVFVLVEGLLIYAIIRYRRRPQDGMPEQIHGNTRMELSWTVGSGVLVLILFFFTLGFYQQDRSLPDGAYTVHVTGRTWQWDFEYADTGVTTTGTLNVPAGQPVLLEIASDDVQHSFWVPEISGKVDAIPGRVQLMWFRVDEPGEYYGQCAEYCGLSHANMLITVNVMPEQEFASWIDTETAAVAAAQQVDLAAEAMALEGDVASGQQLYTSLGCVACHSLDGTTLVGPSFQGLGQRAGETRDGYTAHDYVAESILHPCDYLAEGFETCVMPQNYADQLTPQDLADLIAFAQSQ